MNRSDREIDIFTRYKYISTFDNECQLLWKMESERIPTGSSMISSDESFIVLSTRNGGGFKCLDGYTGKLLWSKMETGTTSQRSGA